MVKILQNDIAENVVFGEDVTVVAPVNLDGCSVGQGTFVNPSTEIQSDVAIGKNCRIQSHAFICSLVSVGNNSRPLTEPSS